MRDPIGPNWWSTGLTHGSRHPRERHPLRRHLKDLMGDRRLRWKKAPKPMLRRPAVLKFSGAGMALSSCSPRKNEGSGAPKGASRAAFARRALTDTVCETMSEARSPLGAPLVALPASPVRRQLGIGPRFRGLLHPPSASSSQAGRSTHRAVPRRRPGPCVRGTARGRHTRPKPRGLGHRRGLAG